MTTYRHWHSYTYHGRDSHGTRYVAEAGYYDHAHEAGDQTHDHPVMDALEKRFGFPSESPYRMVHGAVGKD